MNYAEEQLEHAIEKENRCYNEECQRNNKNGLCLLPTLLECKDRDIEQPISINYKEEYLKLRKENKKIEELEREIATLNKRIGFKKRFSNEQIENIKKLEEENEELHKHIEFKTKYFYELNDKYIELEKELTILKEQNNNTDRYVEKENNERLKREVENLKQVLKVVAYFL